MASQIKRYKVIYKEDIPQDLVDLVASESRLGSAKGGLYDFASIRVRLLVINQAWTNQPADADLQKRLETLLDHLEQRGHILEWDALR